jgi:superfamily II DNA helicase RecQ
MGLYGVPKAVVPKAVVPIGEDQSLNLDDGQKIRQLGNSPLVERGPIGVGLLTQLLREFFNDDQATFRSPNQQEAFYLMMKHVPYLFLILPTAAGKTTLFLFGASLFDTQVTIIVIPLISLKLDLLGKAKALGLRPIAWDPSHESLPSRSRLILVQIEHVIYPKFLEMATSLISQKRLARVIWDECHLIPLSKTYRPVMNRAWHALALGVPMVFASATLPRHLQRELSEMLHLGTQPYTLRANLTLKHMAYRVKALPPSLTETGYPGYLSQFIKTFALQHGPFGPRARPTPKVIIFCRTKASVDGLFDTLQPQAARFHSGLSDDEKLSQLDSFRVERSILLATSGIGAGYDFPDVNLVIYFMPGVYEITNFMQESGRAGRSPDCLAWSYCLVQSYQLHQPQASQAPQPAEKAFFQQYLLDQICRRRVISRVFDGEAIESYDPI